MRDHFIPDAVLFTDNGKITGFGEMRKTSLPEGCNVIDAQGLYVGPGFVDIHTHSDGKIFFQDAPKTAAQHHLKHGTTTLFPALYYSMDTAGSKMTLDIACRNMIKHTGASLVDVFKFASYNPSRVTSMLDRGERVVGKRADLVLVDHRMNVAQVILNGQPIKL